MSSKQKIAISAIGIVLVLAIIGLTIGLVLVAATANATSSMKVTYTANNVACTITASGVHYKNTTGEEQLGVIQVDSKDSTSLSIDATQEGATHTMGSFKFADVTLTANSQAVYHFSIKNDATTGAKAITVEATIATAEGAKNVTVVVAGTRTTSGELTYTVDSIAAGATADVYVCMDVTDANLDALATGTLTLTITQVAAA